MSFLQRNVSLLLILLFLFTPFIKFFQFPIGDIHSHMTSILSRPNVETKEVLCRVIFWRNVRSFLIQKKSKSIWELQAQAFRYEATYLILGYGNHECTRATACHLHGFMLIFAMECIDGSHLFSQSFNIQRIFSRCLFPS